MFSVRGCIRCRTTVSGHSPWKGVQETLFLLRFDSGNVKKHKTTACFRKESGWKHCFFFQTRSFGRKNRKQFVPTTPFGQKTMSLASCRSAWRQKQATTDITSSGIKARRTGIAVCLLSKGFRLPLPSERRISGSAGIP